MIRITLVALAATGLVALAWPDSASAEPIDCWSDSLTLLESIVCDDPVLSDWDDALAAHLAGSPGAMVAVRTDLAEACDLATNEGEADAIRRLERTGCLAPRYRDVMYAQGLAADTPPPLPPDQVHPLCLGMAHALWGETEIASLPMDTCRLGTGHIPVNSYPDGTLFAKGRSFGASTFVAKTPLDSLPDGRRAALIHQNTGGTGVFSAVVAYTPGPTLSVETLVQGGDRCNGGINAARRDGADWIVAFNITPADIAEFIGTGASQGVEELSTCASCCAGSVEIRLPADGEGEVLFLQAMADGPGSDTAIGAEACLLDALGHEPVAASAFLPVRARFEGCLRAGGRRLP